MSRPPEDRRCRGRPRAWRPQPHRTVRYNHWLEPEAKQRLLDAAHARGITPAVALAAVFADTI
ncbi:hypothetical protein, partial [Nocardia cyriacigeorgica]|uniref:hypothetical protein n=1 Tax=Nocardia cyriacigeorgica TaxID=135487 RepID=UPI002458DE23